MEPDAPTDADVEAGVSEMARMLDARDEARRALARYCALMLGQETPTGTILRVVDSGALALVSNLLLVNPRITADEMRTFRIIIEKLVGE